MVFVLPSQATVHYLPIFLLDAIFTVFKLLCVVFDDMSSRADILRSTVYFLWGAVHHKISHFLLAKDAGLAFY